MCLLIPSHGINLLWYLALEILYARSNITKRIRHSSVPWRVADHLWGVIGNDDTIEMILLQDFQHTQHINVAVIDECFVVVGNTSPHIA